MVMEAGHSGATRTRKRTAYDARSHRYSRCHTDRSRGQGSSSLGGQQSGRPAVWAADPATYRVTAIWRVVLNSSARICTKYMPLESSRVGIAMGVAASRRRVMSSE